MILYEKKKECEVTNRKKNDFERVDGGEIMSQEWNQNKEKEKIKFAT